MVQSRYTMYGLALILLLGIVVRFIFLASKTGWAHDEAISSICAAGHLGSYHEMVTTKSIPYGNWVQARRWEEYWKTVQPFCWGQIRSDLAHYDIHPPLYFWLLNFWSLLVGVHLWSGSLLNLLLDVVTGIVLCKLARDIFKEPRAIAVILCLWFLSPSVVESSGLARQYSLLVLWSVLITFLTIRLAEWEKPLQILIPFILVVTAGFLTHYHFFLPLVGCMLFLLIKFGRGHFFRWLIILGGVVLSVILFVVIHPEFYTSFRNQQSGGVSFTWGGFIDRCVRAAFAFGPYRFKDAINAFYGFFSIMAAGIYVMLIILAMFLLKFCRKNKISIWNYFRNTDPRLKFVTLLFFGLTATVITLYLTFFSPFHAIGGRYLVLSWPFIGFALWWVLGMFAQKSRRASWALCVMMVLLSYSFVIAEIVYVRHRGLVESDVLQIEKAPNVIIDNVNRGVLPRLVWHLPGETEVFIARQEDLIAHPELWTPRLQTGSVYISQLSYDSDDEGREKILAIIRQSHQVRRLPRRLGGLGEVYIISN